MPSVSHSSPLYPGASHSPPGKPRPAPSGRGHGQPRMRMSTLGFETLSTCEMGTVTVGPGYAGHLSGCRRLAGGPGAHSHQPCSAHVTAPRLIATGASSSAPGQRCSLSSEMRGNWELIHTRGPLLRSRRQLPCTEVHCGGADRRPDSAPATPGDLALEAQVGPWADGEVMEGRTWHASCCCSLRLPA